MASENPLAFKLWNERGYEESFLKTLSKKDLFALYCTEFNDCPYFEY